MRTKLQKFFTRLILSILGLCVIVVTLFLFLYVFWKGEKKYLACPSFWTSLPVFHLELQAVSILH